MNISDGVIGEALVARVVHRSVAVDQPGSLPVIKLMFNIATGGHQFDAGMDIAFLAPDHRGDPLQAGLRHYSIESVGKVPFEESIDITIFVRGHRGPRNGGVAGWLTELQVGETVDLYGPFPYPFYPPVGSRSNVIMIGAGTGMVPFRWLARKIQARQLDWMGKVLMIEGPRTGAEHLYMNNQGDDQDQYFDPVSFRAFEALKTRYSATALDRKKSAVANMEAFWRLLGQGSVYVYLAGCRSIAAALDEAMSDHLRLHDRWSDAKAALIRDGHWLEQLHD